MKLAEDGLDIRRAAALRALIHLLGTREYRFVPPTPATHARVLARDPGRKAKTLADMLGWSLPFERGTVDAEIEHLLEEADALALDGTTLKSRLRAATLGADVFLHSAYPTISASSVFLGPDSYRFARLIRTELGHRPCRAGATIADIGAGAGVGGLVCARLAPDARIVLTDVNAAALELARVNAGAAGISATLLQGDLLAGFREPIDLAIANPPYIADGEGRTYRDGGAQHGAELSVDMTAAALPRLAPGGRMILYTGSAIVRRRDALLPALSHLADRHRCALDYSEIDPDVFGEELERDAYRDVDRIAVIAAIFARA